MRKKDQMLHFRVSRKELERIQQKKEEIGIRNMGAIFERWPWTVSAFSWSWAVS